MLAFYVIAVIFLFYKYKIYCKYQQYEGYYVVPRKCFSLETECYYCSEHDDGDGFLYYFQLYQREWAAVDIRADAVGGNEE